MGLNVPPPVRLIATRMWIEPSPSRKKIGPHVSESVAPGIAVLMSPTNVQLRKSADLISAKDACRP